MFVCLGAKMFVQQLTIWDSPLTAEESKNLYLSGCDRHLSSIVTSAVDLLRSAAPSVLPDKNNVQSSSLLQPPTINAFKSIPAPETDSECNPTKQDSQMMCGRTDVRWGDTSTPYLWESTVATAARLLADAKASTADCMPIAERLDRYAEAAGFGNVEALHIWASLLAFGSESAESNCGMERTETSAMARYTSVVSSDFEDISRALYAFIRVVELGKAEALVPLALVLLTGVGLSALLLDESESGLFDGSSSSKEIPLISGLGVSPLHSALKKVVSNAVRENLNGFQEVTSDNSNSNSNGIDLFYISVLFACLLFTHVVTSRGFDITIKINI